MLFLRSLLFNLVFYLGTTILAVAGLPTLLFGRKAVLGLAHVWSKSVLFMLAAICGQKVEFRGLEHLRRRLDAGTGCILASKHQSAWETVALLSQTPDFSYILKRELTFIPIFGQYLARSNQIAIDRASRGAALRGLVAQAGAALKEGRAIFIFPEGTRRAAGAPPVYKNGVAHLYASTSAFCVPVALNSGLFWPRNSFLRRPGCVLVEFLPEIAPGLKASVFAKKLQTDIETASDRLIAESLSRDPSLRVNLESSSAAPAPVA